MKVLVIWSSPNKDGLTASAKNRFINGLEKEHVEIEEVHLSKQNIEHCRACGNGMGICIAKGKCVIKDDFEKIYQKMREADGIVFASAVYWWDLTENMKAFMDRLRRCDCAVNGDLRGKSCFLIACAGGTGNGAIDCLNKLEQYIRHMGMQASDRLPVQQFSKEYMLPALETAGELYGRSLKN